MRVDTRDRCTYEWQQHQVSAYLVLAFMLLTLFFQHSLQDH